MSVKTKTYAEFMRTAAEQDKPILTPLEDDAVLLDSGLDFLCFAIVVSRLEDDLGVDPFATAEDLEFPVTFGDFVNFYEAALAGAGDRAPSADLQPATRAISL